MHDSTASDTACEESPAPATGRPNRGIVSIVALILAIAAVALSAWAALRPPAEAGNAAVGDDARAAAKQTVCDAFETVRQGISLNTNASAPGGPNDIAGGIAVAANARLALFGGGEYLLARIDPAVPDELNVTARDFANILLDIGATAIAGIPTTDPVQADRLKSAEGLSETVAGLCRSA